MNRRIFVQTSILATASTALIPLVAQAANGKVGKMDPAEFLKITKAAGAKVAAVKPDAAALSKEDEELMMQVAMGGMMQLEVSRVAMKMATSQDVKVIAQAEVEEQTVLSEKLKEIAMAKKVALPEKPDEKTEKELAKLQKMTGTEFDRAYLKDSGIAGHKLLHATMEKVEAKAKDGTLKTIATLTLPLIKTHLQVSEDEAASMG